MIRIVALSAVGFALLFAACGMPAGKCTPQNCSFGCCDSAGTCQGGSAAAACGTQGAMCQQCAFTQTCQLGVCVAVGGGGPGGGSGGGGGTTGGGGGTMGGGGGTTGGGTGGGTTGGGTGGGTTGGGTGGGTTGGGTGGGTTGGGTGGGTTGGGTGGGTTGGGTGGTTGGGGGTLPGDTCALAMTTSANSTTSNLSLTGFANDYDANTTCKARPGYDRVFAITVPGNSRTTAVVTPTATLDPTLAFYSSIAACGTSCVKAADLGNPGDPETLSFDNTSASSVTVYLVVDGYTVVDSAGTFTLALSTMAIPPDDTCSTATVVSANGTLTSQTTVGYTNDYAGGTYCATTDNAPDRAYSLSVPPGQRVAVTVTPTSAFNPIVQLVAAPASNCTATLTCVAGTDLATASNPERATFYNTTTSTQQLYAIVDGDVAGTFTLSTQTNTPIANDTCNTSNITLVNGSRTDSLTGFTADYGAQNDCLNLSGPDRVYKVTLLSNQAVSVFATPQDATATVGAMIFSGDCERPDVRVCEANMAGTSANSANVAYTNSTGGTQTVFVVIGFYTPVPVNTNVTISTTIL
ncbi:MAG: hypothetical protein U0228_23980 [Myxococcaceae bacterium]